MKKLLIAFSALTFLFAACNNDKTASAKEEKTTTTDNKDDKDSKTDDKDDAKTSDDNSSSRTGWSPKDINDFVNSCVGEASKGMTQAAAQKYCECMQVGIEKMYPRAQDAAMINMESEEVKNMVMDCLN